ncbi:hypothetical protein AB0K05_25185 [Nonomuraea sp. NPDC049486]|uniref:hypothetical protein n=1 Tax=Nonomuraea sp. NPDC049486 TaxID=3155773 RepID=UPI00344048E7
MRGVRPLAGVRAPSLAVAAVAVAVLGVAAMGMSWVVELSCDVVAARRHGAAAAVLWNTYASRWTRARQVLPWWQRPLRLPARILPTHPPI